MKNYIEPPLLCLRSLLLMIVFMGASQFVLAGGDGKQLYQRCAACHLATGEGVVGMFPPLKQRLAPLIQQPLGRDYLVMVIQAGLMGPITIDGQRYQGVMPAQGAGLQAQGIAEVINYLMTAFNADTLAAGWQPMAADEVTEILSRYPTTTAMGVHAIRKSVFPNDS